MPSVTIKLPAALDKKVRAVARARGENISEFARRAIEREVTSGGPDFATLAARYKGCVTGPRDLSTREGYGG
jgi:predicted transcriptional regulator